MFQGESKTRTMDSRSLVQQKETNVRDTMVDWTLLNQVTFLRLIIRACHSCKHWQPIKFGIIVLFELLSDSPYRFFHDYQINHRNGENSKINNSCREVCQFIFYFSHMNVSRLFANVINYFTLRFSNFIHNFKK